MNVSRFSSIRTSPDFTYFSISPGISSAVYFRQKGH